MAKPDSTSNVVPLRPAAGPIRVETTAGPGGSSPDVRPPPLPEAA
jgi:hypothetical protein